MKSLYTTVFFCRDNSMEKNGMKMIAVGILALVVLSTVGSGFSFGQYAPWPMYGGNAQHNWLSPYDASQNKGELKWKLRNASGTVWDDEPPVIDRYGNLYKLSRSSNGPILFAINSNGNVLWKYGYESLLSMKTQLAIGPEGNIYVIKTILINPPGNIGSYPDYILCAIKDGKELWNVTTHSGNPPVICEDGTILYEHHGLHALSPVDGKERWSYPENGDMSPSIGNDGTIYTGLNEWDNSAKLYAIKQGGILKWSLNISSPSLPSFPIPVVTWNDRIFIVYPRKICSLDTNGSYLWNYTWPSVKYERENESIDNYSKVQYLSIGPDGTAYVVVDFINSTYNESRSLIKREECHYLYALNPDGTLKWKIRGNASFSHPAIGSDGTIFVVQGGQLYALYPNGTVKWNTTNLQLNSDPVISPDGTVYVSSLDTLYAFGTSAVGPSPFFVLFSIVVLIIVAIVLSIEIMKNMDKRRQKHEK